MLRTTVTLRVVRTEWITPHMVRAVLGGPELDRFPDSPYADRYVKLLFPRPDVGYPEPLDIEVIWATLPREQWPRMRTYTVRALDRAAGELTIDFVQHPGGGLAGPGAAAARPGDVLRLLDPRGAYDPDPDADWHLLVGDESALPAIGVACSRIPVGRPALVLLEVGDHTDRQPLVGPGELTVAWHFRDPDNPTQLLDALRAAPFPPGRTHAFVHGEAGIVRDVRRHLLAERGVPRAALSVSGYWRRGRNEEGWRAETAAARQEA